jgi:hypothetical protein
MNITRTKPGENGSRFVTVQLDPGEKLIAIRDDASYRLGEPLDDTVVRGCQITEAKEVTWCVASQAWIK